MLERTARRCRKQLDEHIDFCAQTADRWDADTGLVPSMHRCVVAIRTSWLSCALALAVPAQAQGRHTVRGRVASDSSGSPVVGAEVTLVEQGLHTSTNSSGDFELSTTAAGRFRLRVIHPKFQPRIDTISVVSDTSVIRIVLTPLVQALPTVTVSANAEKLASPLLADFRRRRATMIGTFLTADDLERIGAQSLANVVRGHVGGFDIVRHPSGMGSAFASRHAAAPRIDRTTRELNACYTNVWVNGQLIYYVSPVRQDPPRLEDFDIHNITALEFYRGAGETPIELNAMSAACGTVVIWTELK